MDVLYRSPIDGAQILQDGSTVAGWRKSSRSGDSANCVEVATVPDGMLVRDSKDPDGPVLVFGLESWRSFLEDVKAGELG